MKVITDKNKIKELLERGTEDIFVKENLEKALFSGKPLRIKFGIDPTGPAIHLGRAIPLRKLKAFQDLGHKVVLIVGDFTAKIGDPSDKLEKRPMLTDKEIKGYLKNYLKQIGKIIDISKTEIHYNSKWLAKMSYLETAKLLECFTVQQMSKRRNFKERLDAGQDVFVVELIYPALQGYDSVMVNSDVEIGGFDQLFNLKAGRTVQKKYGKKEQDIMTLVMLEGTDGRKMSSSWGNIISLLDSSEEMFGKIMALKDELIIKYFTLCTDFSLEDIALIEKDLKNGKNPKEAKMQLAFEIVKIYHGEKKALLAKADWVSKFEKKEIPEELTSIKGEGLLVDILVEKKLITSKNQARRLFDEGAILDLVSKEKIKDVKYEVKKGNKFKIGKKLFIEIV